MSAIFHEDVEILNSLGLAFNEARVFLALSQLGVSTAKTISNRSEVAREVVYQTMPKLLKQGLVEELITAPKTFRAISLREAYVILLRRKEEENRRLCARAKQSLKKRQSKTVLKVAGNSQTLMVPSRGTPDFRICQEYKSTQKSIDLTFPAGKFLQWSQYYAKWGIKEAMKRNVKIRVITEQQLLRMLATSPAIFSPSLISKLRYINFKYAQNPFLVELMIFDGKTLFISTTEESNINKILWLRSNNPFILEMANSYFETIWNEATEGVKFTSKPLRNNIEHEEQNFRTDHELG